MTQNLMPLEQVSDLLTAHMDGPLADLRAVSGDEDASAAAWLAAEAVRYVSELTAAGGLTDPSAARAVVGGLAVAASRLSHLTQQLEDWLDVELAAGRLSDESGCDPAILIGSAGAHLKLAADVASVLERTMTAARGDMSRLRRRGR